MPLLAPQLMSTGMIVPMERATYVVQDKRKRSRLEALERLYAAKTPSTEDLPYGIQRLARKPLMLYEMAWWIAVGLVIVDPLDRLEGVV